MQLTIRWAFAEAPLTFHKNNEELQALSFSFSFAFL